MLDKKPVSFCVLAAVTLLAIISGCNSTSPSPTELTGDILLENLISAYENTHTYCFDMNGSVNISGDSDIFPEDNSTSYSRSAIVDNDKKTGKFDIVVSTPSISEAQAVGDIEVTMYFSGDWMYMRTKVEGVMDQWVKSVLPEGYWEEADVIRAQIKLLKAARLNISGEQVIDGTDCYVLRVEPEKKAIWEAISQQIPINEQIMASVEPETMVQDISATYWIIKESYLPKKEQLNLVTVIPQEALGIPGSGDTVIKAGMEMTTVFRDYDSPVSIEIPPEAEDAPVAQGPQ